MLSSAQIGFGTARLVNGKLTLSDVDSIIQNLRMLVGSLEDQYNYPFETDLIALDDSDGRERAAKMAAVLVLLISDGFSVLKLTGKNNVAISKEDQRRLTILYMFSLLYRIPPELTELQVLLNMSMFNVSSSVPITTVW